MAGDTHQASETGTLGVVTLGFGADRYVRQAETLALSLRRHMPDLPIAPVTDKEKIPGVFDMRVPVDLSHGTGVIQKIYLDAYSLFERTLFMRSGCVVMRPFTDELRMLEDYAFKPTCKKGSASG